MLLTLFSCDIMNLWPINNTVMRQRVQDVILCTQSKTMLHLGGVTKIGSV
jgi:hypothetical protein